MWLASDEVSLRKRLALFDEYRVSRSQLKHFHGWLLHGSGVSHIVRTGGDSPWFTTMTNRFCGKARQ